MRLKARNTLKLEVLIYGKFPSHIHTLYVRVTLSSWQLSSYLFQYLIGVNRYELKWIPGSKKIRRRTSKSHEALTGRTFADDKKEMLADNVINMCVQKAEQYDSISFGSIWHTYVSHIMYWTVYFKNLIVRQLSLFRKLEGRGCNSIRWTEKITTDLNIYHRQGGRFYTCI